MKNSLSTKGLSMSQAQSISNLCNQRAIAIQNKLDGVNICSKSIKINGSKQMLVKSRPLPENIVDLLKEKSSLHACQAFLMKNLEAKETELNLLAVSYPTEEVNAVEIPKSPKLITPKIIPTVEEAWGWEQLTVKEYYEYLEAEAYAAHIGKFFHKGGKLNNLRNQLSKLPDVEWEELEVGKKTPITITPHHTEDELLAIHEELAKLHNKHEQRVNYFKAKVKNIVTLENARIAEENNKAQIIANDKNVVIQEEYSEKLSAAQDKIKQIETAHEIFRHNETKRVAALRIEVNSRFQEIINLFVEKN